MPIQTQFIANRKSLFQLSGTTLKYPGPKYSTECPEHRVFKSRNHVLAFWQLLREVCTSRQFTRS